MKCLSCYKDIPEGERTCPACGATTDSYSAATLLDHTPPSARTGGGADAREGRRPPSRPPSSHDSLDGGRFAPGTTLADRYRIVSLLGRGGMGEVYRADDLTLGQPVALKFLPDALSADGTALARFHREVRIARQVSHRNVCRVYDIGEADGRQFLSMEYVRGEELASLLRRIGRLPQDKAVEVARQICAGVAAAHASGVLHRDLKPSNVMIDERGDVRLTDFGLAGLAKDFSGGEVLGTPAYMSPEQLAGRELTERSDIYSLGLILYEVFTGRRAFEAATLAELLAQRQGGAPPASPSSITKDIDPLVERVVMRCLERDPEARPATALQVAAALPGGDPLAAALAAGETPSPEMVAAAPHEGGLRPPVALACLAFVLAGFALAVMSSGKFFLHEHAALEKSPDALKERAREVVKRLGYTDPPTDSTYGFVPTSDYLRYVEAHDASPGRWDNLKGGPWPALRFWYQQSPRYLVPIQSFNMRVTPDNLPLVFSGMSRVFLDPQGKLLKFDSVPPQIEEQKTPPREPDWSALFAEAGLDPATLKPADSRWVPPVNSDARAAWEGAFPGHPQIPMRVEAAAFRGKPVYFEVIGPWSEPAQMQESPAGAGARAAQIIISLILLLMIAAGVMFARHNLRLGRGDRKGAFRLSVFVFTCYMLGWALLTSHVPRGDELNLFFTAAANSMFTAGVLWLFYISLEPYLRRRWPHRIISWSRLLAGDLADPLVGRDVLLGTAFGVASALLNRLVYVVPRWLNLPAEPPREINFDSLKGARSLVGAFFNENLTDAVFVGLIFLFLLLLFYIGLRRERLAVVAVWLLVTLLLSAAAGGIPALLFGGLTTALTLFVLTRFGLLAAMVLLFVEGLCDILPLTSNLSAWYAGGTFFAAALVAALTLYGFRTSLGDQKLFGGDLLGD